MVTRRGVLRMGVTVGLGAAAGTTLAACSGVAGGSSGGSAPSGGSSQSIKIAWWGGADRAKRTQQVIKLFEKKYTSVKVTPSFSDFNSYFQKLNTQAAGGGLPDVIQLGGGYVPQYMHKGQLLDLTPYTKDGTIDISDFDKGQIGQGTVDGEIYAITIGGNMPAIVYNKTMIDAAGMSVPDQDLDWDDFASFATELSKKLPKGAYAVDHLGGPMFDVWMRQRYPESYTTDNKPSYDVHDVEEYLTYWQKLRKAKVNIPGEMVAAEIQNGAANAAPLTLKKCAIASQWSNFLGQYQILMKDTLGMMRCPTGGKQAGDFVQASQFFSVGKTSKFPKVAAEFINFFTHDADALKVLGVERGVPASAKSRDIVEPTLDAADKLQVEFMSKNSPKARPKSQLDPANSAEIGTDLQRAEQSIALKGTSVTAAAKKFMTEVNKALQS